MGAPGTTKFQIDLRRHLRERKVERRLREVICEIAEASKYIINSIRTGELGVAGTSNLYGEEQLALDVLSDRILQKPLKNSGVVSNVVSEENNEIINTTKIDILRSSSRRTRHTSAINIFREKGSSLCRPVKISSVRSDRISLNGEAIRLPTTVKVKNTITAVKRPAMTLTTTAKICQYQAS